MADNIVINDVTYNGVEAVALEDENGGATMYYPDAVRYNEQDLTDDQKEQARNNINASSVTFDKTTNTLNICSGGGNK